MKDSGFGHEEASPPPFSKWACRSLGQTSGTATEPIRGGGCRRALGALDKVAKFPDIGSEHAMFRMAATGEYRAALRGLVQAAGPPP
jgi:hypothetical protein